MYEKQLLKTAADYINALVEENRVLRSKIADGADTNTIIKTIVDLMVSKGLVAPEQAQQKTSELSAKSVDELLQIKAGLEAAVTNAQQPAQPAPQPGGTPPQQPQAQPPMQPQQPPAQGPAQGTQKTAALGTFSNYYDESFNSGSDDDLLNTLLNI